MMERDALVEWYAELDRGWKASLLAGTIVATTVLVV